MVDDHIKCSNITSAIWKMAKIIKKKNFQTAHSKFNSFLSGSFLFQIFNFGIVKNFLLAQIFYKYTKIVNNLILRTILANPLEVLERYEECLWVQSSVKGKLLHLPVEESGQCHRWLTQEGIE